MHLPVTERADLKHGLEVAGSRAEKPEAFQPGAGGILTLLAASSLATVAAAIGYPLIGLSTWPWPWQLLGGIAAAVLMLVLVGLAWRLRGALVAPWPLRGLLLGHGVLQTGLWSHLATGQGAAEPLLMGVQTFAIVMALLPSLYWLPGLLLQCALLGILLLPGLDVLMQWWLGLSGLLLIIFSLLLSRLLAQNAGQYRAASRQSALLEEWESRCLDMEERLLFERETLRNCKKELADVHDLAGDGSRIKSEFLATISHEIRTPLNGILPILEMLQGTSLNEEQRRFVRAASNSSRHLLRIINDLLDFARAESGKLRLESIELELEETAQSVLDLMAGGAERKQLQLKLHIAKDVTCRVQGDPLRLRQVLANLVSNAIKFTEQGEIEVSIEQTGATGREVEIRFSVTDTGIGLSPTEVRGLFSSFSQADASTTRKFGGTGLGLAICRRLVELMDGRIGVRSALGQGSTFWFVLPLRRSLQDLPSTRTSLQGIRVVSAIGDSRLRSRLGDNLRQWGMREEPVTPDAIVRHLRDAAMLGRSEAFECLLLDDGGPDGELEALFDAVRRDPLIRRIPIILLNHKQANMELLSPELPYQQFGVHVLPGPFRPEPLRRLLYRVFDVSAGTAWARYVDEAAAYFDLNLDEEREFLLDEPVEQLSLGYRRPRVLLVEDNPVNLGVVKRVLKRLGAGCLVAENGQQALEILYSGEVVDAVLMDCQMPVMDGYEATRLWREYERTIGGRLPIIAMTANVMPGDADKCRASGMDDYLAKPVGIASLARILGGVTVRSTDGDSSDAAGPLTTPAEEWSRQYLDRSVIEELREFMEEEFREILCSFLENSPELMGAIETGRDRNDCAAMASAAHSLKSSSANMGALRLSALARSLETTAREGDVDAASAGFETMIPVFIATCSALRLELAADAEHD